MSICALDFKELVLFNFSGSSKLVHEGSEYWMFVTSQLKNTLLNHFIKHFSLKTRFCLTSHSLHHSKLHNLDHSYLLAASFFLWTKKHSHTGLPACLTLHMIVQTNSPPQYFCSCYWCILTNIISSAEHGLKACTSLLTVLMYSLQHGYWVCSFPRILDIQIYFHNKCAAFCS